MIPRSHMMTVCGLLALTAFAGAGAQTPDSTGPAPVHVPLAMSQTPSGTYKAALAVKIGNLNPISFGFDTGSTGLHVFADVDIAESNTGITCSQTATQVTYGNPPRMIFTGVMCEAILQIGSLSTPEPAWFAYLTAAQCPAGVTNCKPPNPRDYNQMKSYGVFGAGLTGRISGTGIAPPPLLSLPGHYGEVYSVVLSPTSGELILGSNTPADAVIFRLRPIVSVPGERWGLPEGWLYVNGAAIGTRLIISFDTGNGVPWLHNVVNPLLPKAWKNKQRIVRPSTILGVGPLDSDEIGTTVTAGLSFANAIKIKNVPGGRVMTNPGIQAFLGHTVTYSSTYGHISFAPVKPSTAGVGQ